VTQLVALTGATGFIGSTLLKRMVTAGWRVRALTRRTANQLENVEWISGDLDNTDSLLALVNGATAVVHCAGTVRGRNEHSFMHANAGGTENLIRAVIKAGMQPRFLLISSLAARAPQLSWYAASKHRAEQIIGSVNCFLLTVNACSPARVIGV